MRKPQALLRVSGIIILIGNLVAFIVMKQYFYDHWLNLKQSEMALIGPKTH